MKLATVSLGTALLVVLSGCSGARSGEPETTGAAVAPPAVDSAPQPVLPEPDLGYNAREGRAVYRHYCVTCHGDEGHGDGFNAYNLDPKPRDLADPEFQAKRTDDDLAAVIRTGGGVAGLSSAMPPWGRTLDERQIGNVVDYIRTLEGAGD